MSIIQYLTRIEFDNGALGQIPNLIGELNIQRPMVVTDPFLAKSLMLEKLNALLPSGSVLFSQTPQNPTEEALDLAVSLYKERQCDGLIAIGGGSSIDLAKGVALLATHDGPLEQYAVILGGLSKIKSNVAPVIAVPTTAGTGSEVGRGALITLRDGRKLGFISPYLIPKIALCDPELTYDLPAGLTAATGMDALTHCIETFLSPKINPPADAIALDGASRASLWIEKAYQDGTNKEARWNMMMASLQGGLTFQKGLGAVHSMSHPLGGLKSPILHHGTLNALILPAVLRFNRPYCEEKFVVLEQRIGLGSSLKLEDFIEGLNSRLGLPKTLSEMGVKREQLPKMIEGAVNDHSTASNPRPLTKQDFMRLFDEVF